MIMCNFQLEVQREMNAQTVDMAMGVGGGERQWWGMMAEQGKGPSVGLGEGGSGLERSAGQ